MWISSWLGHPTCSFLSCSCIPVRPPSDCSAFLWSSCYRRSHKAFRCRTAATTVQGYNINKASIFLFSTLICWQRTGCWCEPNPCGECHGGCSFGLHEWINKRHIAYMSETTPRILSFFACTNDITWGDLVWMYMLYEHKCAEGERGGRPMSLHIFQSCLHACAWPWLDYFCSLHANLDAVQYFMGEKDFSLLESIATFQLQELLCSWPPSVTRDFEKKKCFHISTDLSLCLGDKNLVYVPKSLKGRG